MIKNVINLGSGSKGNSYFLELQILGYEKTFGLLLECGFAYNILIDKLASNGKSISDIDAVLVSHKHKDHSFCIKELYDRGVKIYSNKDVFKHYGMDNIEEKYIFKHNVDKVISDGIRVKPLALEHDEKKNILRKDKEKFEFAIKNNEYLENFAFIITINKTFHILFMIDTMFSPYNLKAYKFNVIMIEANYFAQETYMAYKTAQDDNRYGDIERYKRLLYSHMSVETCIKTLNGMNLENTTNIFLMHTSASLRSKPYTKYLYAIKDNIYKKKDIRVAVFKNDGGFVTSGI